MYLEKINAKNEYLAYSRRLYPTIIKLKVKVSDSRIAVSFCDKVVSQEDPSTLKFDLMLKSLKELWEMHPSMTAMEINVFGKVLVIPEAKKDDKNYIIDKIIVALNEYVIKNPESLIAMRVKNAVIKSLYSGDIYPIA